MPIYEYRCEECRIKTEHWCHSGDRHTAKPCRRCGQLAAYTISAPKVFGDYEPYESPASGRIIEGRRARREDFARTGTRPFEPGEHEHARLRAIQAEKEEEQQIDAAVDQTLHELTL